MLKLGTPNLHIAAETGGKNVSFNLSFLTGELVLPCM